MSDQPQDPKKLIASFIHNRKKYFFPMSDLIDLLMKICQDPGRREQLVMEFFRGIRTVVFQEG